MRGDEDATLLLTKMIQDAIRKIAHGGESLSREEARTATSEVLAGECTSAQIAALLTGLHMKGETVEEIVGFAEAIRAASSLQILPGSLGLSDDEVLVDTCGTGGDGGGTFNISTAAAFVAAGAGVKVAKHGNRSITSQCGSADVLEALGVKIEMSPATIAASLKQTGFAFLYAPALHPGMKYVQPVRKELGIKTIFNLLGPLTNPAGAGAQVVGVYSLALVEKVAEVLAMLGVRRAFVVHGLDGLDEITITGKTRLIETRDGIVHTFEITPEQYDIPKSDLGSISGGDAEMNAAIIREILAGQPSARRNVVELNAAAVLVAAGAAPILREGLPMARESIDSGAALAKLNDLVRISHQVL